MGLKVLLNSNQMLPTKTELLGQLENIDNNFVIGTAGIYLLSAPNATDLLQGGVLISGKFSFEYKHLADLIADQESSDVAIKEFYNSLYRMAVKESFEVLQTYCSSTKQMEILRSYEKYRFWRLIRNAASHDFHWRFSIEDSKFLPIAYNNVILDETMRDKPLRVEFLGYDGMFQIHVDMKEFAEAKLS